MPTLNIVLVGTEKALEQSIFASFRKAMPKDGDYLYNTVPITVSEENYTLEIFETKVLEKNWTSKLMLKPQYIDVFILTFPQSDPDSYKVIKKLWFHKIKRQFPNIPIILMANKSNFKKDEQLHGVKTNQLITTEMGEQLGRRMNAANYLEYSFSNETDTDCIYEEIVRICLSYACEKRRKAKRSHFIRIFVAGNQDSEKTDLIRRFVFSERLNVLGERINEEPYFYSENDNSFSTPIEIDGEEYDLDILDCPDSLKLDYFDRWSSSPLDQSDFVNADIIMLTFSVVEPDSFSTILTDLISKVQHRCLQEGKPSDFTPLIILIGNQTDLRNDSETLNNLSKQGKQPITFENGEQLANIPFITYWEISDETAINHVFEEVLWSSLRHIKDTNRKDTPLKRIFNYKITQRLFDFSTRTGFWLIDPLSLRFVDWSVKLVSTSGEVLEDILKS